MHLLLIEFPFTFLEQIKTVVGKSSLKTNDPNYPFAKERGIQSLEICLQTYMHKMQCWANEVHGSCCPNPVWSWAQAETLQRASSRNVLKPQHCLALSHGSLLSLPWRCNIFPHLNPGNFMSQQPFSDHYPPILVRGLVLVLFSSCII